MVAPTALPLAGHLQAVDRMQMECSLHTAEAQANLEPEETQHERQNWGLNPGLGLQSLDTSREKADNELVKEQSLLPAWSTKARMA